MKIISKESDYYDVARGFVSDDDQTFYREPQKFYWKDVTARNGPIWSEIVREYNELKRKLPYLADVYGGHTPTIIFFCGRFHVCYLERYYNCDDILLHVKARIADFKKHRSHKWRMQPLISQCELLEASEKEQRNSFSSNVSHWALEQFKAAIAQTNLNDITIYAMLNAPCFALDVDKLIVNPSLKEYHFEKVLGAFQAYQEISLFLGNQLANAKLIEPRPITDKMKAETKGFNDLSFRKEKTEDKSFRRKHPKH